MGFYVVCVKIYVKCANMEGFCRDSHIFHMDKTLSLGKLKYNV